MKNVIIKKVERIDLEKEYANVSSVWKDSVWHTLVKEEVDIQGIYVEDHCVGYITLTSEEDRNYTVGYRVFPQYQGNHYAMNAMYILCHDYPYTKLYAEVKKDNLKSRHILTHNGFEIVKEDKDILYLEKTKQFCKPSTFKNEERLKWIVLAGGCFWGLEHIYAQLHGVKETICGYANGIGSEVNYASVCKGDGNYKEAVAIAYDPRVVAIETILDIFFLCIDPTQYQRQKEDIGKQYQTGIYYLQESKEIHHYVDKIKVQYPVFYVELEELKVFYTAEQYHQSYLEKHPNGYCHIPLSVMKHVKELNKNLLEINITGVE